MSIEPSNINKFVRTTTLKDGSKLVQIYTGSSTLVGDLLAETIISAANWFANIINDAWAFVEAAPSQSGGSATSWLVANSALYTIGDIVMAIDPSSPTNVMRATAFGRVTGMVDGTHLTVATPGTAVVASDLVFRLPAGSAKNSDLAASALPNYNGDNPTLRIIG